MKSRRLGEHPARNALADLWHELERSKEKPTPALIESAKQSIEFAGNLIDQQSPIDRQTRSMAEVLVRSTKVIRFRNGRGSMVTIVDIVDPEAYQFAFLALHDLKDKTE